jgi:hypothetical protein
LEKVSEYLQQSLLGPALARLCRLATQIGPSGIQCIGEWEQRPRATEDFCLKTLRDGTIVTSDMLGRAPLSWLRSIDFFLYEERSARINSRVSDGEHRFWLVRRTAADVRRGYRERQLGNLFHHLRYHHVFPASVDGIATEVAPVPEATATACADILSRSSLKVAVARFDDKVTELFTRDRSCNHFHMDGLDPIDSRMCSAQAAISLARTNHADLLVFPELTLPAKLQHALAEQLMDEAADPDVHQIPFILLGSFHEALDGKLINRARLVSQDGSNLLLTDKRFKVTFRFDDDPEEWGEALQAAPAPFGVLPLDIGLLATTICKDAFDGPIPPVVLAIGPDWLLIPSMTNHLGPHRQKTADLRRGFGTVSIVANQPMPGCTQEGADFPHGYIEGPTRQIECTDLLHFFEIPLPQR